MSLLRSEYAGELAVAFTWLSALLPWSVGGVRITDIDVTVINIRFVLFQLHFLFGTSLGEQSIGNLVQLVHRVPSFVPGNQRVEAWLWVGAAVVYLGTLVLSVLFYAREDAVTDRSPVDPVRIFGAALAVVTVLLAISSVMLFSHQVTVPVGLFVIGGFAAVLLRVQRSP